MAMVAGVQLNKNKESRAVAWAISCPANNVMGAQDLFCFNTACLIDLF
jgi:hypothetical protein